MFRSLALLCLIAAPSQAETLRLTGGTRTPVPGTELTVTLIEVEDQRCPPTVDCYWEGMIRVGLLVSYDLHRAPADMPIFLCNQCDNGRNEATVYGLTFGLISLEPSTEELEKLGRAPELADYVLTVDYGPAD